MMREAVQNERLATSQRLEEAYLAQLETASNTLLERWQSKLQKTTDTLSSHSPPAAFARIVEEGFLDSLIIRNDSNEALYPQEINLPLASQPVDKRWPEGEALEFIGKQYEEAIAIYQAIAIASQQAAESLRAKQAMARCYLQQDKRTKAIALLQEMSNEPEILDKQGRSYSIAAQLRLLQLFDKETIEWKEIASRLLSCVNSYEMPMSSSQRRFVMQQLQLDQESLAEWDELTEAFLEAELLASEYLSEETIESLEQGQLLPAASADVFYQKLEGSHSLALFKSSELSVKFKAILQEINCPTGVAYNVSSLESTVDHLFELPLEEELRGWRLGLSIIGDNPFEISSQQRRTVHLWIACLVVAVTCLLAWLLATTLMHRLKLARLKNDLVATVSHELKTPLASVRLLVDTLLESTESYDASQERSGSDQDHPVIGSQKDLPPINVREYLKLISQENARLTRLIDRFLTFSRIQRGKERFDRQVIEVNDVIQTAVDRFKEHYVVDAENITIDGEGNARVHADRDALILAVVNLLENAWKYGGEQKQIGVSIEQLNGTVKIAVSDKGIGLSSYDKNRIFDKFYQVDQRVARTEEGCGLGLSIVSSIMKAHGGTIDVRSKLKEGSTFTLTLAVVDKEARFEEGGPKEGNQ